MNEQLMDRMIRERYSLLSIDLFSGPGGLCTGFKWAGILPLIGVEWTDSTVMTYSVTHNTDVFELSVYENNPSYLDQFLIPSSKSVLIHGDINKVSNDLMRTILINRFGIDCENETVDVVSGGAPCESFSLAGTRTEGDQRDDLFSNIVRISRALRTKIILFENVKGILSKPRNGVRGAIFRDICDTFEDPNQEVTYRLVSRDPNTIMLKASDYGVPQMRERIILISVRTDLEDVIFNYPQKTFGPNRENPTVTVGDALSDLPIVQMNEEATEYAPLQEFNNANQEWFVSIMRGELVNDEINTTPPQHLIENGLYNDHSISSHKGPGHIRRKQELIALIRVGETMKSTYERLTEEGVIDQYRHLFPDTIYGSRNRRLLMNEPSFTVTSHCLDEILHPFLNRSITPREAGRLQSFPDWYQFYGPYVQFHGSKEQDRYEQIGDAIPPLLGYSIGRQIVLALDNYLYRFNQ